MNFTGSKNYTICTATKSTDDDYVNFKVTSGKTLNMWAAHYKSGIVFTQTVVVKTTNKDGINAYFKTGHSASKKDKVKARAELYTSSSSIQECKGTVDFR